MVIASTAQTTVTSRLRPPLFTIPRTILEHSGLVERLGSDHVWHSIAAGVKAARHAPALAATVQRVV